MTNKQPCGRAFRIAALILTVAAWDFAARASEPATNPDPARFDNDIRTFESWDRKNSVPSGAVLFVGSSSIRLWPTADDLPGVPVINRGFGGSHVSDVNYLAERIVLKYKPRHVVFYAGDNDIAAGKTPRQVFDDFQTFVTFVHERLPQTRITYLPIKPSLARWQVWPQMREANALVEQAAKDDERLTYVDTATPMLGDDRRPRPELFLEDGLHLDAAGYRLWVEILSPHLQQFRLD